MQSNPEKASIKKPLIWLGVAIFGGLVPVIYYSFSHGLRSSLMTYCFIAPLCLDLFYWVLYGLKKDAGPLADFLLGAGDATLMVYLVLKAVYDMAETYSNWIVLFLVLGIALLVAGFVFSFVYLYRNKASKSQND